MRAIVIREPGGPEVLEETQRPTPEPGTGQIRVRVRASALNRADLLQRRGGYPAPPGAPADIPGLEYAGVVDALGPGTRLWREGDRVMGIVGGGGHAEYLCVHEREAMPVPAALEWEQAAAIPEVFLTAYDALFRQIGLGIGDRLLIHAVGSGVGTAGLQLSRAAGVRTLGTSRTPEKLTRALELGLDTAIATGEADWTSPIMEETNGQGVTAILDLVGGDYLAGNLEVLSERGRIVVVGTVAGTRPLIDLGRLLRKRATIVGTVLRSRALEEKIELAREFSTAVLPLFASGEIAPVVERVFKFSEIGDAHRLMESNRSFGKIVLRW